MNQVDLGDLDPPPLFSPNVYVPERGEKLTFGSTSYMMRLSRFMVSDYDTVRPILVIAKRYKITVTWKRVLEVFVHEAHDFEQHGFAIHDVRCKMIVGNEVQRTRIVEYDRDLTSTWNEGLKFHVGAPSNIEILAYCKNAIIPNKKLGRITIKPRDIVERSTVTEWFPFNTKGEIKLSITLSPPALAPFRFVFTFSKCAREWHILDQSGEKIFTVFGQWPYAMAVGDGNTSNIDNFNIQNTIYKSYEKEFELKIGSGNDEKKVIISQRDEHDFHIQGHLGVEQVKSFPHEFCLYSPARVCVGSAKAEMINRYFVRYAFEIRPSTDLLLVLGTMFLIAKLRHVRG
jgi:hypothetical protein